ncbi:MAG: hypothetical protein ACE5GM_02490 [bacterium]
MKTQVLSILLIALLLAFLPLTGSVYGRELSLLTKSYTTTAGASEVYQDSFTAPHGPGKLLLRNGPENARVTGAFISLNGTHLVTPMTLHERVTNLEVPLYLKQHNTLTVEIRKAELAEKPGRKKREETEKTEGRLFLKIIAIDDVGIKNKSGIYKTYRSK